MVKLVYFARVREQIGMGGEQVELPDHVHTVADLADWLVQRGGHYALALADRAQVRAAVDLMIADFDSDIRLASEIAFFPPVTGG